VRDAWADHGCTKAEVETKLQAVAMQMDLLPVPEDYVQAAIRHFLGVNAQSGIMPPYGLLDVAEVAGITSLNPELRSADAFLQSLYAEVVPERATPQAVANALKNSASWGESRSVVWSWFEESDEVDAILAQRGLAKAKRKAALLAMPLQKRRLWWAELIGWMGHTVKQTPDASGWEEYILVARELLGDRPLDEFGIMNRIAEETIAHRTSRW
jgi:hypothetical protein